jgi:quinol monooxygenase YgiN
LLPRHPRPAVQNERWTRHPGRVPHCLGWELRRSVEEPGHYVVRIEWDSPAGHVHGFRESAPFQAFFGELSAFGEFRLEMEHFELVRNQLSAAGNQERVLRAPGAGAGDARGVLDANRRAWVTG